MKKKKGQYVPREYYKRNKCNYRNCIFNYYGRCLCRKDENPPMVCNKACYDEVFLNKSPEEKKKYFRKSLYRLRRNEVGTRKGCTTLFEAVPHVNEFKVKVLSVNPHDQVEIKILFDNHQVRKYVNYRDLFLYELKNRFKDYLLEEERGRRRVNLGELKAA